MAQNDGGAAFPFSPNDHSTALMATNGMNLRDWFAGQALAGLGDWTPNRDDHVPLDWTDMASLRKHRAEWAYKQADAMLAARGEA